MEKQQLINIIKSNKHFLERRDAASNFEIIASPGDEDVIIDMLRKEDDNGIYIPLLDSLGKINSEKALDYLIANLTRKDFTQYCIGNIAKFYNEKAMRAIAGIILNQKDSYIRNTALSYCEQMGAKNFVNVLIEAFHKEKEGYIRTNIIKLLGKTKQEIALDSLRQVLQSKEDWYDKTEAISSLYEIGTDRAFQIMTLGLADENQNVVNSTRNSLQMASNPNIVNYLEPILKNSNLELRNNVIIILSSIKSKKALELLWFVANNDANSSIKLKAKNLARDLEEALNQEKK